VLHVSPSVPYLFHQLSYIGRRLQIEKVLIMKQLCVTSSVIWPGVPLRTLQNA